MKGPDGMVQPVVAQAILLIMWSVLISVVVPRHDQPFKTLENKKQTLTEGRSLLFIEEYVCQLPNLAMLQIFYWDSISVLGHNSKSENYRTTDFVQEIQYLGN